MKNTRNYFKELNEEMMEMDVDNFITRLSCKKTLLSKKNLCALIIASFFVIGISGYKMHDDMDYSDIQITYVGLPKAIAAEKKDYISIPEGTVKANPFLPYRVLSKDEDRVSDIPAFELIAPPESVNENSDAARVMDTIVSGILYDKYSPSAILNIEGSDYLVKKGDIVNNYKVLDISPNSVSVKLGNNTYKAGIGEILTEGTVNYNNVSNLSKKFGGEKR